ncbi:regulator of sigma D [Oceanospirillum multiglobuliferum]|uniref:Anti-RNA polymerase sigma 70 factor n=1 Tax=Oceanospirillum multiglobuliferum TaxID=64969 RepID=A0A1T4QCW4_9GAMM|nr:Rsd/AlgQ family anti-sigma factor [Oceanospirillum multiglobuliferum]OPX56509.1 hypothetical protein BTE48_03535 [Oceanospirillum multiglobuliferum]SKA01525.1 regulator of sigma D [Oceanospirillum multiglobuliferum]
MLEGCKNAQERWSGVHELIDKWLHERQSLIVCYTGLVQTVKSDQLPRIEQIKALCDVMVDYTSAGHFEVFEQLYREAEAFADQSALDLGEKILPKIQVSTEVILDFNEKIESGLLSEGLAPISEQLSLLGEHLADRFQHEDQLIETLHTAHQELAST